MLVYHLIRAYNYGNPGRYANIPLVLQVCRLIIGHPNTNIFDRDMLAHKYDSSQLLLWKQNQPQWVYWACIMCYSVLCTDKYFRGLNITNYLSCFDEKTGNTVQCTIKQWPFKVSADMNFNTIYSRY